MIKLPGVCSLLLLGLLGCKKPYTPYIVGHNLNYLVVEGTINAGQDSTIIKLSRTVLVSSAVVVNPELNASVTVLSDGNAAYALTEQGNGYYAAAALNLNPANKYGLKIVTSKGKVYQSDFLQLKNSPPIDSINYIVQSKGVQINVTTHDPANKTTYYRWSFVETYVIHAHDESLYELLTDPRDTVVQRRPSDQVYTCWATDTSTSILLASTRNLKQDMVSQNALTIIPLTSEKIADRYSILVKQYALTPGAYGYWQLLKRNTEQLGNIFDAQPSELGGNIHCITTPSEPVIGYLGAGAVSQVRIYIDSRSLPALPTIYPLSKDGCEVDSFYFKHVVGSGVGDTINDIPIWIYSGKQFVLKPIGGSLGGIVTGYQATDRFCADCTLRGTNKQPAFWK